MLSKSFVGVLSLREVESLTGFDFKRIKRHIGDLKPEKIEGASHFYDAKKILPLLYQEKNSSGEFSLDQERARFAARQADRTEILIEKMKGNLIEAQDLSQALNRVFSSIRAKLLALPKRISPNLVFLSASEIESHLHDSICEILEELTRFQIPGDEKEPLGNASSIASDVQTTTSTHSEFLG